MSYTGHDQVETKDAQMAGLNLSYSSFILTYSSISRYCNGLANSLASPLQYLQKNRFTINGIRLALCFKLFMDPFNLS